MTTHQWRILTALVLGFSLGQIQSLSNGLGFGPAAGRSLAFALLVWLLSWASETTAQKGYSPSLGFWLVILLNLAGILVLLWLPPLVHSSSHWSTRYPLSQAE